MTRLAITRWPPTGMPAPTNAPLVPHTRPLLLAVRVRRRYAPPGWINRLYGDGGERFVRLLQRQAG